MTIHHPRKQELTRFQLDCFKCGILLGDGENRRIVVFTCSDDDAINDDDESIPNDFEFGQRLALHESTVEDNDGWKCRSRDVVFDYHGSSVEVMWELKDLAADMHLGRLRPTGSGVAGLMPLVCDRTESLYQRHGKEE